MQVPDWAHPPERWYRDVWLIVITGMVALALLGQQDALDKIQQSRVEVSRTQCRSQNERHDNTIGRLDARIAELSGRERARADRNRDFTVSLIESLAPKRDCRALVERIRSASD